MTEKAQIYGLIGKAMTEIGAIGKDSKNQQQGFMYRGIDAVYNALNPVMAKYGLFICPEILDHQREERTAGNGRALLYSIITVRYTVYAPDGSFIQATVVGEGMDSGDKATNKAMSVAMKYAMFQLFMIPTEDLKDPDAEVHEVVPKNARAAGQKQAVSAPVTSMNKVPPVQAEVPQAAAQQTVDVSTVKGFLLNEIAFLAKLYNISDKNEMRVKFEKMRKSLVAGGVVPDVKADDMTMEQARNLIQAIHANFPPEKAK